MGPTARAWRSWGRLLDSDRIVQLSSKALTMSLTQRLTLAFILAAAMLPGGASAQVAGPPAASADLPLFAIEIKVGPKWDVSKPPQEQTFFQEHSANLRRMRDAGVLLMGARYSDKGLVVVSAATAAEVRAQMDQDPSVAAGTFMYEVHPFNVFYGGALKSKVRR